MSTVVCTTVQTAAAGPVTLTKQEALKAWGNLNGTGTIADRASFNVASYTDVTTGIWTMTFTSAFAAATFCTTAACGRGAAIAADGHIASQANLNPTTSTSTITSTSDASTQVDCEYVAWQHVGTLA